MSYIGSTPVTQSFIAGTDYFNGTGSATAFTLSRSVVSVNDIQATVNNVVQVPNDAYTVSGTTITFTSAPSAGTNNIYVRYLSTTTQSITPSQNTVSYSTLNSDNQSKLGISFKNRIINGAMVISQRNGTSSVTVDGASVYTLDRWEGYDNTDGSFTVQQTSTSPVGFVNSLKFTVATTDTSLGATQFAFIRQKIEGYNTADLGFGTANAKTVTLSFWVYSSLTGTFGGALGNDAGDRGYPFSYTISSANTWEQKSITITGDTTGTWGTTNGTGIALTFGLGVGSTYSGTAGSWQAGFYCSSTGATNVMATSGATFYLTGVQLEVGTQATTFDYRSYGTELMLCQRYYEKSYDVTTAPGTATALGQFQSYGNYGITSASYISCGVSFKVNKRAAPTIAAWDANGNANACLRFNLGVGDTYNQAISFSNPNQTSFAALSTGVTACGIDFQWTASAEL